MDPGVVVEPVTRQEARLLDPCLDGAKDRLGVDGPLGADLDVGHARSHGTDLPLFGKRTLRLCSDATVGCLLTRNNTSAPCPYRPGETRVQSAHQPEGTCDGIESLDLDRRRLLDGLGGVLGEHDDDECLSGLSRAR